MEAVVESPDMAHRLGTNPRILSENIPEYLELLEAEFGGPVQVEVDCGTIIDGPPGPQS